MRYFLLLILIASVSVSVSVTSYTYADLALKMCPNANGKQWTIHGWWPEFNEHRWPSWCNKSRYAEFNESVIEPIRVMMADLWGICPSWNGTSDIDLWKHEWEKHGTCTDESVFDYFKHAIDAYLYAESDYWFGCCANTHNIANVPDNGYIQCLIPFSKNDSDIKWLGYCHHKTLQFQY